MTNRRVFLTRAAAAAGAALLPLSATAQSGADILDRQEVQISTEYQPGEIVILPSAYFLYYVTAPGRAMRYGIAVAKPGESWKGTATIRRKVEWPTWRPTDEMIEKNPETYGKYKDNDDRMEGGPNNPLGARAMYLFQGDRDTMIRIHGTTQPQSIGRNASSGCFRMLNDDVKDLFARVPIGTRVTVL